jgi:hypothetical protein
MTIGFWGFSMFSPGTEMRLIRRRQYRLLSGFSWHPDGLGGFISAGVDVEIQANGSLRLLDNTNAFLTFEVSTSTLVLPNRSTVDVAYNGNGCVVPIGLWGFSMFSPGSAGGSSLAANIASSPRGPGIPPRSGPTAKTQARPNSNGRRFRGSVTARTRRSVTTVQVNHQALAWDGVFKYQHATGDSMAEAIRSGFSEWVTLDFVTLLDALQPNPKS